MKIAEYNEMMAYLLRPAQEAKLVDDLEPGSLRDELLKDFDPSQETYEEYLQRKSMRETAAQGGVIGKDGMFKGQDMGTRKGFAEIKFDPNKLLSEMTDEEKYEYVQDLTKKQKIAAGLEKKRVSTKIDVYTDALNEYDKMVKEAFNLNDASKLPKPFAQFLNDKGLKSGTYFSLKNFDILPNIKTDVVNLRLDLANKLIDESNNQLKFIEKEALLKKANFTFDQINALSAMKSNTNKLDKAGDKARKAYDFIFKGSNNSFTDVKELFNPRAKIAELTGLTGETISKKFSVQTHDPEGYNIYTKLGNAKVQSAINKKQNPITFLTFKNTEGDIGSQAKSTALRKERLDKAGKKAGKGVADILEGQDEVVQLLNDHYKKNPKELLGNTKLRNLLDLTLEDGEIIKKNKYVTDDDFLKLIKSKSGLFTKDHIDEVQFEKLSTEFPIFRQLATYNTNSGLIKSMKAYINKNQNSKDPVIQNKIKKQIAFLEDLKLRIDTPTGRVGSKEVLAAVDRKAGILPNFLAQLRALNITLPSKAKAALYVIGGLGATTLAQAEEVSKTPFPGIKPEGSPRQINPEKEKGFTTGEKLAGAGVAGGAYAARKPILKTAAKIARPVGFPSVAAGLSLSNILDYEKPEDASVLDRLDPRNYKVQDDPDLKMAGLDLLLPELIKKGAPKGSGIMSMIGRGLANPFGRAARAFTPVGATLTAAGIGKDYYDFAKDEIAKVKAMTPEERDFYNDLLMDEGGLLD